MKKNSPLIFILAALTTTFVDSVWDEVRTDLVGFLVHLVQRLWELYRDNKLTVLLMGIALAVLLVGLLALLFRAARQRAKAQADLDEQERCQQVEREMAALLESLHSETDPEDAHVSSDPRSPSKAQQKEKHDV